MTRKRQTIKKERPREHRHFCARCDLEKETFLCVLCMGRGLIDDHDGWPKICTHCIGLGRVSGPCKCGEKGTKVV